MCRIYNISVQGRRADFKVGVLASALSLHVIQWHQTGRRALSSSRIFTHSDCDAFVRRR